MATKRTKTSIPAKKPAKPGPKPVAKTKLDEYGIARLCSDIVGGMTLTAAAKKVGVSIGTLITWIDADVERSACAREARAQAAKVWDEEALALITNAKDPFELAKARESAQHLRWRASKIAPKEYGDKLALGQADDLKPLVTVKDMTGRKPE